MQKKSNKSDIETLFNLPVKLDYLYLQDCFSDYKNPKKKIFDLTRKGYLQLIKRGVYFNLKSKFIESMSYETIANSLHFPSYVSMEWALQYYGIIMDRVKEITSVTTSRTKSFRTPYGSFTYKHINKNRYPIGYINHTNNTRDSFFIARPEKAILDYVNVKAKNLKIKTLDDIQEFLESDLRLDLSEFYKTTKKKDLLELLPFYHRNSKEYRILKWLIHNKESKA